MTLGEIVTLCQSWLDDPNGGYFSRAVLLPWINNAQFEVEKRLIGAGENYYLVCKQTSLVINQPLYLLPSDFLKLNRLELIRSGTPPNEDRSVISPITFNQQDYLSQKTGDPDSYAIKKNALVLFPTPDSTKLIRLNYSYRVAPLVLDSDIPDVPEQYHEMISVIATLDGALKDHSDMTGILKKRDDYDAMMKSDSDQRNVDQPRSIVVTEDDGFGILF